MDNKLNIMLSGLEKNISEASDRSIVDLEKHLSTELPEEYARFMKEFDGGEGGVGNNGWLCLFPMSELIKTNNDYRLLMSEIPDYFLIGKDAADTGYAFHKKTKTFHSFGLMSNFETDLIDFCGNNFIEFVEHIYFS